MEEEANSILDLETEICNNLLDLSLMNYKCHKTVTIGNLY